MRRSTQLMLTGALYAGGIGYLTVAVLFAVFNVLAGRSPFYTAAVLGGALFYGLQEPAAVTIEPGPIFAYNAFHLVAFLIMGLFASWLVALAERFPAAQYVIFAVLVVVGFHVYAGMLFLTGPLLGDSAWWEIGVATVTAAIFMGWYLLRAHPLLRRELREIPWDRVPEE